jgi:oligopeptide transport system ATP-binding protein
LIAVTIPDNFLLLPAHTDCITRPQGQIVQKRSSDLGEPLLDVQDLKTYFRTKAGRVRAVDGVSFSIQPGEKVALVGESGCGKSVTSLSIMRLIAQPAGEYAGGHIYFEGQDLLKVPERTMSSIRGSKIGMIFQDPMTCLNPTIPVGEQISEGIRQHLKRTTRAARQRAIELLEMVGIPSAAQRFNAYPHQFSGGMRQRVMIAMALACNPKLLIADEPTTALDVTVQAQILELITSICNEFRTALILITHDLGVVAGTADRVLVMYAGKVVEDAPTEQLFADPRHPYTIGLLGSVPRLDEERQQTLQTIEGAPPDLLNPPTGCSFKPRCYFSHKICNEKPALDLAPDTTDHRKACWVDVTSQQEQRYAQLRRRTQAYQAMINEQSRQAHTATTGKGGEDDG